MSQQGTGIPAERSRRNLSTSAPCPNPDGESRQEADVQMQQPAQDEKPTSALSQPSQESPRRCESAPRASSPGTGLTRDTTSRTSTPQLETIAKSSTRLNPLLPSAPSWPIEPPVTRATLSELDVTKIIHNPKLRHDINFDPELHFRPNLDGEKGRKKQERANQFWCSLNKELSLFLTDRLAFDEAHPSIHDWTLPTLLKSVKEIMHTLVPQRDRFFLDEGFNIELLMQQFDKGVADLDKLALWLCQVLKSHCAPMRDEWVDAMYSQLSNGNRTSDLVELVNGMRSLLGVLEAMKLDVANHQIRCLRPLLIEDTIQFEQKFFRRKLQTKRMDIAVAKKWYKNAHEKYAASITRSASLDFGETAVFFEAMSRLMLPSSSDRRVPNTFLFDDERLQRLRLDVLDAINLQVCMRMYEDLERIGRYNHSGDFATSALDEGVARRAPSPTVAEFNFNTPLETSRPSSLHLSSSGSASSSPRSSLHLPAYVASDSSSASRSQAREVYDSLLALLQSAPPAARHPDRWQAIASSMAVQIFRYTQAPQSMLPAFEEKLVATVCGMDSPLYKEVERSFHQRFMDELSSRVRQYRSLPGVALFSAATSSRVRNVVSVHDREAEYDDGVMEDIAVRLAQIGVLHWRVWSRMGYINEEVLVLPLPN